MAAITRRLPANNISAQQLQSGLISVALAAAVFALAQRTGSWGLAGIVVLAVELWLYRYGVRRGDWSMVNVAQGLAPVLVMGWSVAVITALMPRLATQVVLALAYAGWRWWWTSVAAKPWDMASLLVVQAVMYEAVFLMAAIWRTADWEILGLVWCGAYASAYGVLSARGERATGVLAAAWGLVSVEVSWVLLLWLFTYATPGGYVLVPQPALVLVALAYCFGSIYVSAKQGSLSRSRLLEYLVIGLILIAMVITGTSWKGTV